MRKLLFIGLVAFCLPFTACKKECEKEKKGNFCLQNTTFDFIFVEFNGSNFTSLDSGEKICMEVDAGLLNVEINPSGSTHPEQQLQFTIPVCGDIQYDYEH